jgi:hypothetical protein
VEHEEPYEEIEHDELKVRLKINENMEYMKTRSVAAFIDNVDMKTGDGS